MDVPIRVEYLIALIVIPNIKTRSHFDPISLFCLFDCSFPGYSALKRLYTGTFSRFIPTLSLQS